METRTMEFRDAVERLQDRPTRAEIAEAGGWSPYTVKAWMLPEASEASRQPGGDWRAVVARLARERAERLERLADDLEATG